MDLTGLCIALGLVGAAPHAGVTLLRHRRVDTAGLVTLFLGFSSIPMAVACIWAAIVGDPRRLPSNWRELLAVAGVIAVSLPFKFVVTAYGSALRRTVEVQPEQVRPTVSLEIAGSDLDET